MDVKRLRYSDFKEPYVIKDIFNLISQVWSCTDEMQFRDNIINIMMDNHLFIVKEEKSIIGFAMLHLQPKLIRDGCTAGFIEEVVVHEDYRGQGIGEQLIKHITKYAFDTHTCYKVVLSCFPERVKFYERCGFRNESITMRIDI